MRRAVSVLAIILSLGIALIIGNTIRLTIDGKRDEIEIARHFGATDAFIRRPFLYCGLWYGVLGSGIAWLLLAGTMNLSDIVLQQFRDHCASLYVRPSLPCPGRRGVPARLEVRRTNLVIPNVSE